MKKIIAINSGSSSLKFKLYEMPAEEAIINGIFERIGLRNTIFIYEQKGKKIKQEIPLSSHQQAVAYLLNFLIEQKIITALTEIDGVGHRVAHGGEVFTESSLLNQARINVIEELSELAPLHNPINLIGIKAFASNFPAIHQVGVFDTAFHQSIPIDKYLYPIPYKYYQEYKIRKYGFHGTSHEYVGQEAAKLLQRELNELNLITCHLGNGASICEIKKGKSFDTSMGFTPTAGLMMGTRAGDIDPNIVTFIQKKENLNNHELEQIFNLESGLLGVSCLSSDSRDLTEASQAGHQQATLATEMFISKIVNFIASYAVDLGHVDGLIFTAGIGENAANIRAAISKKLTLLGFKLNEAANLINETFINETDSKTKIMVIPTDEELVIARDTYQLIAK